jgi:hypothetical protein
MDSLARGVFSGHPHHVKQCLEMTSERALATKRGRKSQEKVHCHVMQARDEEQRGLGVK